MVKRFMLLNSKQKKSFAIRGISGHGPVIKSFSCLQCIF